MRIGTENTNKMYLEKIMGISKFCYIDSVITNLGGSMEDGLQIISKSRQVFGQLNNI